MIALETGRSGKAKIGVSPREERRWGIIQGRLDTPAAAFGRLMIERKGARLTVEGRPDAQVLAQVLAVLLR